MTSLRGRRIMLAAVAVVILTGVVVSTVRVQRYRYRAYLHETLYLPSGHFMKELSLGYRELAADLVWLSAVQYYGDFRLGHHNLDYFEGVVDLVTTLDPHFIFAYEFGALIISEDLREMERGFDLLRRGMANNPTSWELPFQLGFLAYVNNYDFDLAGRYLHLAARMPDVPERIKRLAAFVNSKAGRSQSAIELWKQYLEIAEEPWMREMIEGYIDKLERGVPLHQPIDDVH